MLAPLPENDKFRLAMWAHKYAVSVVTPRPVFSRAQLDAAGVTYDTGSEWDYKSAEVQEAMRKAYADACTAWIRSGQYQGAKEGVTKQALIEPAPYVYGAQRLAQPGQDQVAVAWDRTGGSNALNGWRTDAQLVVDIAPVKGDASKVQITARVRGVTVTREGGGARRRVAHSALGELKLQVRDVNGAFSVVVRDEKKGRKDAGTDPTEPCPPLTYTLPRAKLIDHAVDWMYHTDIQQVEGGGYLSRATVSGRCVLMVPPSMDDYQPGTVHDPASGTRARRVLRARRSRTT
ncbi:hypothetical protein [Streptomyces melanogenes]|uniref:hypothetical protein n=1 Tax=Streptomyces melanogenes TaxID=67326 RepID=UPI0037A469BB